MASLSNSTSTSEVLPVSSYTLRIVALFAIGLIGTIGVVSPFLVKRIASSGALRVLKSFGSGIILGTAFIHVLPDAFEVLGKSLPNLDYPLGALLALSAIILTLALEQTLHWLMMKQHKDSHHTCESGGVCNEPHKIDLVQGAEQIPSIESANSPTTPESDRKPAAPSDARSESDGATATTGIELKPSQPVTPRKKAGHDHHHHDEDDHGHDDHHSDEDPDTVEHRMHHHHGHSHYVQGGDGAKAILISRVLEIGISLHSVIIGLAIGVTENNSQVRALFICMCFHQFFEGLALGACVLEAAEGLCRRVSIVALFGLATPTGIGIGLIITACNATASELAQGILDSVSAGILIYMGLVDMVATDMSTPNLKIKIRVIMVFGIALGAASFAALGIWA